MKAKHLFILMLLISFASIGAVAFTPSLPQIATFFNISNQKAELTVTWYLVGYALGQLLYGPLANRYGSTKTIMIGSIIEIIGAIGCILAAPAHSFVMLIISRCIMALGAASGLKMTFTLSSKLCNVNESARVMSLLTMAFAITPGLGVFIGGILVTYFNWTSSFYLMVAYGLMILLLSRSLPEVYQIKDLQALQLKILLHNYKKQFQSNSVIFGGLLVGLGSCVVYSFTALAPFIAMDTMGISPTLYGMYNFIPVVGILIGSLASNHLGKIWSPKTSLKFGLSISTVGVLLLIALLYLFPNVISLFAPMVIIYFGLSFIFGNSAALALQHTEDKGNASAVMSFINMGSAFIVVMALGYIHTHSIMLLPLVFLGFMILGAIWYKLLVKIQYN